jgi:hypothetical protein
MACTDIDNHFQTEANRISNETFNKNWVGSPWDTNELVPKATWPDGIGENPNFITYDRSMPIGAFVTFDTVSFNDGGGGDAGGSCTPTTVQVVQATTRRTMSLKKAAIESQKVCIEDGRMSWRIANQAEHILRNLKMNTRHAWQNARRDEFTSMCTNKAVADSSMSTNSSTFGTGTIGQLVREMLDYWYDKLVAEGAYMDNGLATQENGQPVLPLVLSREAQATLVNNDSTINNIRWSNSSDRLLGPRGSFVNLEGFKHMIDIQAPRWNLVDGAWVRVPFYNYASAAGDAASVNPDYATAEYEDLFIASPQVLKFAIPGSSINSGALSFPAQDYMGNFRWINKYDLDCNPDENIGYFRGILGYGAQPGIPEYGAVLRFRRCPLAWTVDATCS